MLAGSLRGDERKDTKTQSFRKARDAKGIGLSASNSR